MGSVLAAGPCGLLLPGHVSSSPPSLFQSPPGLVGYWGLDADGVNFGPLLAYDLSGNGNHGTLNGAVHSPRAQGQVGAALSFNGTDQYILLNSVSNLGMPAANAGASLFGWINSTQGAGPLISLRSNNGNAIFNLVLGFDGVSSSSDSVCSLLRDDSAAGLSDLISATQIIRSTWMHIGSTLDRTTGLHTVYMNGVNQGSATYSGGNITPDAASSAIGTDPLNPSGVGFYTGLIDDVRVYSRALSAGEVIGLYQAGLQGRRDAGRRVSQGFNLPVLLQTADVLMPQAWM